MILSKICIVIGGLLSLAMAFSHSRFYVAFNWKEEFANISLKNQRILYTIHLALLLLFLVFAILSLANISELSRATGLAFGLLCTYSLFWLWRAIWQVIYFRPPKHMDKVKKPLIYYVMLILFVLLFFSYSIPVVVRIACLS